jgi:hypothetical protein
MHDDLEYWIHIGIGDDIIKMPEQRPEYQHLIVRNCNIHDDLNVSRALSRLSLELKRPVFLQPTFYRILWLTIRGKIKW